MIEQQTLFGQPVTIGPEVEVAKVRVPAILDGEDYVPTPGDMIEVVLRAVVVPVSTSPEFDKGSGRYLGSFGIGMGAIPVKTEAHIVGVVTKVEMDAEWERRLRSAS